MTEIEKAAIYALAEIDNALGIPGDGCNSTEQTIWAIKLLKLAHDDDQRFIARAANLLTYCKHAGSITNPAIADEVNDWLKLAQEALEGER